MQNTLSIETGAPRRRTPLEDAMSQSLRGDTRRVTNESEIVPGLKMLSRAVEPDLVEVVKVDRTPGFERFTARVTNSAERTYRLTFFLQAWVGAEVVE